MKKMFQMVKPGKNLIDLKFNLNKLKKNKLKKKKNKLK